MRTARINPFTLDELLGVVDVQSARTGRYADVTLVLGLTGLRLGELRGLRVGDVVSVAVPGADGAPVAASVGSHWCGHPAVDHEDRA